MSGLAHAQLLSTMAAEYAGSVTATEAKLAMAKRALEQHVRPPGPQEARRQLIKRQEQELEHYLARKAALEAGAQALRETAAGSAG